MAGNGPRNRTMRRASASNSQCEPARSIGYAKTRKEHTLLVFVGRTQLLIIGASGALITCSSASVPSLSRVLQVALEKASHFSPFTTASPQDVQDEAHELLRTMGSFDKRFRLIQLLFWYIGTRVVHELS
eukprot:6344302-Amphidinium_carterae.2